MCQRVTSLRTILTKTIKERNVRAHLELFVCFVIRNYGSIFSHSFTFARRLHKTDINKIKKKQVEDRFEVWLCSSVICHKDGVCRA